MERVRFSSGSQWESIVGYSRAVRVGPFVHVSGTAAVGDDGEVVGIDDAAAQTRRCLEIIAKAMAQAGARLEDIVRTRIYVVEISNWEAVGRVHGEFFGAIRPATTLVEVSRLIAPGMLVEIEADAHIDDA